MEQKQEEVKQTMAGIYTQIAEKEKILKFQV